VVSLTHSREGSRGGGGGQAKRASHTLTYLCRSGLCIERGGGEEKGCHSAERRGGVKLHRGSQSGLEHLQCSKNPTCVLAIPMGPDLMRGELVACVREACCVYPPVGPQALSSKTQPHQVGCGRLGGRRQVLDL